MNEKRKEFIRIGNQICDSCDFRMFVNFIANNHPIKQDISIDWLCNLLWRKHMGYWLIVNPKIMPTTFEEHERLEGHAKHQQDKLIRYIVTKLKCDWRELRDTTNGIGFIGGETVGARDLLASLRKVFANNPMMTAEIDNEIRKHPVDVYRNIFTPYTILGQLEDYLHD